MVWWLTPRCRSRSSASEYRTATIGRPPRWVATSTTDATSTPPNPYSLPVPTTPGPGPTTTASAPARATATSRADGTLTAS